MRRPGGRGKAASGLAVVQAVTEVGLLPLTPHETLREVLERVRAGLRASAVSILLPDESDPEALVVGASAGPGENPGGMPMAAAGIAGRVLSTRQPAVVREGGGMTPANAAIRGRGRRCR